MELILALISVPSLAALVLLVVRKDGIRDVVAIVSAAAIAVLSILFAVRFLGPQATVMSLPDQFGPVLSGINLIIDLVVMGFIIAYALRYKRMLALALAVIQLAGLVWFEFAVGHSMAYSSQMRVDTLTVIMVLIIGIVGTGICVYALGYMKDFQEHESGKDRRPWFFAIMFAFLSAMYNIVVMDNLVWVYTAWEVTTLCSFLLIGFTKTEEAINNAFRQIVMNMLGGIAFQAALLYLGLKGLPLIFSEFLALGSEVVGLVALPVALFAFAGITKAAQMPFHTWLLGAMVAPTPTSALLHSSTMVKAGVFLLVKLSPMFLMLPAASFMVIMVGGITFALCSFMAISQSNAKRVLAYSTVANLGLIVACAGVGTPEAVWAAIFLIIFHAVAKSLLFLCVGTAEHHIGSRDIEDMDALFNRMPRLARFMMLGIMGMFIAPFGMLVAKWATLVSFAETGNVALIVLLAFGSAATFMFWAKWMGKLSGIAAHEPDIETTVHRSEWAGIIIMALMLVVCLVGMPFISSAMVSPYLLSVFGMISGAITADDMLIMGAVAVFVVILLMGVLGTTRKKLVGVYMAGVTVDADQRTFKSSLGAPMQATARNWYLDGIFGEKKLTGIGSAVCLAVMVVVLGASAVLSPAMLTSASSLIMYAPQVTLSTGPLGLLLGTLAFAILGPVLGCLLAGLDRKISARMQGRVGPPLLQPYYDVRKLIAKDNVGVNNVEGVYVGGALLFTILGGGIFFAGGNLLLCVFMITLSALFFILAAYSTRSPYAEVGADRETLQVMAYEPMILFMAVGFYLAIGTFDVAGVMFMDKPIIVGLIPVFLGLLFVLTIKLRKSPFDLSYSHHAHQELVKGITTEMSGRTLAMVEVMHWAESVLFLAWVGMFFVFGEWWSIPLALVVVALVYFLEIWIDNNFARVKWQKCLKWSWIVALVLGTVNIAVLVAMIVL